VAVDVEEEEKVVEEDVDEPIVEKTDETDEDEDEDEDEGEEAGVDTTERDFRFVAASDVCLRMSSTTPLGKVVARSAFSNNPPSFPPTFPGDSLSFSPPPPPSRSSVPASICARRRRRERLAAFFPRANLQRSYPRPRD